MPGRASAADARLKEAMGCLAHLSSSDWSCPSPESPGLRSTGSGSGGYPATSQIERSGFFLYFPLTTSLIISVVLSVILWLVNR
jgi:hypothetical protein